MPNIVFEKYLGRNSQLTHRICDLVKQPLVFMYLMFKLSNTRPS